MYAPIIFAIKHPSIYMPGNLKIIKTLLAYGSLTKLFFDGWYAPNRTFLYSRWISKLYRNVSLYPTMLHMATGFDNRLYLYWLCGHHFLPTLNVCRYFCGNTFTQPFTVHPSISVAMLAVCICKYMFVNRAPQRHRSQILPFFWREYQILPIFWGRCPNFDKYQLSKNLI